MFLIPVSLALALVTTIVFYTYYKVRAQQNKANKWRFPGKAAAAVAKNEGGSSSNPALSTESSSNDRRNIFFADKLQKRVKKLTKTFKERNKRKPSQLEKQVFRQSMFYLLAVWGSFPFMLLYLVGIYELMHCYACVCIFSFFGP